jgi:hypothetical protein
VPETLPRRYVRLTDPLPDTRECRQCRREKPLNAPHFQRHNKGGFRHVCRVCMNLNHQLGKYGLTREQFESVLAEQDGRCKICRSEFDTRDGYTLGVDHCHETCRLRGILCGNCNLGISYFKHDAEIALAAVAYLRSADTGLVVSM